MALSNAIGQGCRQQEEPGNRDPEEMQKYHSTYQLIYKTNRMNKKLSQGILVLAGGVLFSLIFWQEKLGINTVLFDAFILTAVFYLYAYARQNAVVRWLVFGHLICLAMVIIHNTLLSKIAFATTLLLVAGFAEYVHRSAWFAGGSMLLNVLFCVASFVEQYKIPARAGGKRAGFSRIIRFAVFPLLIVAVFFLLYLASNSVFQAITVRVEEQLQQFFAALTAVFSPQRLLFLLLGVYITGSLLMRSKLNYFSQKESNYTDALQRNRLPWRKRLERPFFAFIELIMGRFARGTMALKNEHITGIISLLLLNILLLAVNAIDVSYLWFNFDYMGEVWLYKMVHEGTELLIVSIVLAMLVVLFFFKGNLNFYRKNKWLKYGAYAWILQNSILVVSVFLRDYYYIARYGLAYKRIGVLFFLLMVLIGLTTVVVKIAQKRTAYFLFRVNAWAGIIVLVLASTIHWDEFIAGYNLQRKDKVPLDTEFLLTLSDKALPLLDKNATNFQPQQLQNREALFLKKQEQLSWLSWNYADDYTRHYFRVKTANVH
jgi:hypothetical protein